MAVIGKDIKHPLEIDDWDVDYADWMPSGDGVDFITTSVRVLSGPDTTPLVVDKTQATAKTVKVWLSGGADGAKYRVQVTCNTMNGRVKEAEFDIAVKEI